MQRTKTAVHFAVLAYGSMISSMPRGGGSAPISRSTSRVRAAGSVGLRPEGVLLSAVPALAVYVVFQKYIIKRLTGASK